MKLVHGVGINDADYNVSSYATDERGNKKQTLCHFYDIWKAMLQRCYWKNAHLKWPTYTGCSVDERWHSFMAFREWMMTQDWEGKHLDKDILVEGNKVYGPETCVFVDRVTNNFLLDNETKRGNLPIGVTLLSNGKFRARVNDLNNNRIHLGCFTDPISAHEAWQSAKYKLAIELSEKQKDNRISKSLVNRYSSGIIQKEL